ncbi:FkbM family methyltransferase [Brasilonema sp. UFV-L1]|uniref:FkbM family methyltransferase n=1 Tax=Brasilonema sp. UFV-L1 TaxID=2234130 RepID=UPI00145C5AF0|nr:FkbM family methyltransferase [Brasilonema sp. UFV-L1]NMG05944.1 hypothetical protein [Brasilonema sp. UFV-L1]
MKASTIRKFTQFPLLPNRVVKWLNRYDTAITYPQLPVVVQISSYGRSNQFEIRNLHADIQRNIYFRGYYEIREINIVKQFLRAGDIFVDVGANIGLYTILASNIVGQGGRVIAFEPSNQISKHLRRNLEINFIKNVKVEQIALSRENGLATWSGVMDTNEGAGSIIRNPENYTSIIEEVKTLKFDDYFVSHAFKKIRFMKIDVEGAEMLVLQGMSQVLEKKAVEYLMIEVSDYLLPTVGSSSQELFQMLQKSGYDLYLIKYLPFNRYTLKLIQHTTTQKHYFGNIFAVAN